MGRTSSLAKEMIQLYKGAERSPFLHEIDVSGWIRLGWSRDPQQSNTPPDPITEDTPNSATPTRESRETELLSIYFGESGDQANWRLIKKIADDYGIEKPLDGWDDAIPLILGIEFPEAG